MSANFDHQNNREYPIGFKHSFILTCKDPIKSVWQAQIKKPEHLLFLAKCFLKSMKALETNEFTQFDALSTANCCHGISHVVQDLIGYVQTLDTQQEKQQAEEIVNDPQLIVDEHSLDWISRPLLALTSMYVLRQIVSYDIDRGRKTIQANLKKIQKVSTNFCRDLIHKLQQNYSNLTAESYHFYSEHFQDQILVGNIPLSTWGHYIKPPHLRLNQRGLLFASSTYSIQVCLGHLIRKKGILALIKDVTESKATIHHRELMLLRGDGESNFRVIDLKHCHLSDPVYVISGLSIYDPIISYEHNSLKRWAEQVPLFIQACENHHPQFPENPKDETFDSSPIHPVHPEVIEFFQEAGNIDGVSLEDPSFFLLSHVYVCSIEELTKLSNSEETIPFAYHFVPFSSLPNPNHN